MDSPVGGYYIKCYNCHEGAEQKMFDIIARAARRRAITDFTCASSKLAFSSQATTRQEKSIGFDKMYLATLHRYHRGSSHFDVSRRRRSTY
jgi:hypothetical protein